MSDTQEFIDTFYWKAGRCCAGCDWWRFYNALIGDCTATPPDMPGIDRAAMVGMTNVTMTVPGGHSVTTRDYHCGAFKDSFDWTSLSLTYRKRVGAPIPRRLTPTKGMKMIEELDEEMGK